LGHGKFACAVNADEQVKLVLSALNLGDVDMEAASSRQICIAIHLPGNGLVCA
jgi:hypothetical protein